MAHLFPVLKPQESFALFLGAATALAIAELCSYIPNPARDEEFLEREYERLTSPSPSPSPDRKNIQPKPKASELIANLSTRAALQDLKELSTVGLYNRLQGLRGEERIARGENLENLNKRAKEEDSSYFGRIKGAFSSFSRSPKKKKKSSDSEDGEGGYKDKDFVDPDDPLNQADYSYISRDPRDYNRDLISDEEVYFGRKKDTRRGSKRRRKAERSRGSADFGDFSDEEEESSSSESESSDSSFDFDENAEFSDPEEEKLWRQFNKATSGKASKSGGDLPLLSKDKIGKGYKILKGKKYLKGPGGKLKGPINPRLVPEVEERFNPDFAEDLEIKRELEIRKPSPKGGLAPWEQKAAKSTKSSKDSLKGKGKDSEKGKSKSKDKSKEGIEARLFQEDLKEFLDHSGTARKRGPILGKGAENWGIEDTKLLKNFKGKSSTDTNSKSGDKAGKGAKDKGKTVTKGTSGKGKTNTTTKGKEGKKKTGPPPKATANTRLAFSEKQKLDQGGNIWLDERSRANRVIDDIEIGEVVEI